MDMVDYLPGFGAVVEDQFEIVLNIQFPGDLAGAPGDFDESIIGQFEKIDDMDFGGDKQMDSRPGIDIGEDYQILVLEKYPGRLRFFDYVAKRTAHSPNISI